MSEQMKEHASSDMREASKQKLANQVDLTLTSFAESEEKQKLDQEIKAILDANMAADLQIEALLEGKTVAEADSRLLHKEAVDA